MLPQVMGCGSGMTYQRRLRDWQQAGVWERLHHLLLDRLGQARRFLRVGGRLAARQCGHADGCGHRHMPSSDPILGARPGPAELTVLAPIRMQNSPQKSVCPKKHVGDYQVVVITGGALVKWEEGIVHEVRRNSCRGSRMDLHHLLAT